MYKLLKGKVVRGIGDLSQKMETISGLLDAYERKTGMRFYPGSLNVELDEEFSVPANSRRLEKEDYGGTVSSYIVPCKVFGKKAFILRTERNESGLGVHSKRIIEVASDVRLRDTFKLQDGDNVEISIISD